MKNIRGSRRHRRSTARTRPSHPSRRQILTTGLCFAAGTCLYDGAKASENEWPKNVFSRNEGDAGLGRRNTAISIDQSDLGTGPVPLASGEMLDRLDYAIETYERIVAKGGWPVARRLRFLQEGRRHESIAILRRQLAVTGDLVRGSIAWPGDDVSFDREFAEALKRFQYRHGLRPTGRLDRLTRYHLGFSARDRLAQLRLNRRRIAALARDMGGDRYVLVNVPAFQLEAVDDYEVERRHTVIVGRSQRETPDISATITGVNFFPFWRVPESIARRDLIPRAKSDVGFLRQQHFRVTKGSFSGPEVDVENVDWASASTRGLKFRQDPGPWNALGLVRINMPNKDIIYLHDTPLKRLFKHRYRAFSAGCIRVHDVMKLVLWIGNEQTELEHEETIKSLLDSMDPADLREARPKQLDIKLRRPVRVKLAYVTAWVGNEGEIFFRADLYNRDRIGRAARRLRRKMLGEAGALSP